MGEVVLMNPTAEVWERLKANADREQALTADARSLWPQIGADMARLRNEYRGDAEFGAALVMHGIEYNKNDRAAFVWMGSIPAQILEDAMARCTRTSADLFRRQMESWALTQAALSEPSESADRPSRSAESPESARSTAQSDESLDPSASKTKPGRPKPAEDELTAFAQGPWLLDLCARRKDGQLSGGLPKIFRTLVTSRKDRAFMSFIVEKLRTVEPKPKPYGGEIFHAGVIINNLNREIERAFVFYDSNVHRKVMAAFIEHFDLLLQAAASDWTLAEFKRATLGQSSESVNPWTLPNTQTTLEAAELPESALLQDGTVLRPRPIIVCGEMIFPSKHSKLDYATAYTWAQHCHEIITELPKDSSAKTAGLHIAHLGKKIARQHGDIGTFMQTIGIGIQARGNLEPDRREWLDMEGFHHIVKE